MARIRTNPKPDCPICGAKMRLRRPRPGQRWRAFWGCSQYPECDGSREIGEDGRPKMDDILDDGNYGLGPKGG